ncbi:hypothetical protein PHYBOEH_004188 [Phytophthora boehmeriae]|uniref:RxLR effector protein n=1 Tax=Phytophthora boehmeriae TaxID=109152 RepID=A0A8T1WTG4_9STRA|nr:hypothetical protein PHYBOEH_004188 [Phytophthora boehmeriae]
MGSPDLAQPSDITQSLGTGNRRLRRNKDDDEEDITDVNDIDSANEEERTVTAKMLKQFEKWHARGDTVASVYRKYKIQSLLEDAYNLNKWDDLLANPKWQKYINYDEFVNKLNAAA